MKIIGKIVKKVPNNFFFYKVPNKKSFAKKYLTKLFLFYRVPSNVFHQLAVKYNGLLVQYNGSMATNSSSLGKCGISLRMKSTSPSWNSLLLAALWGTWTSPGLPWFQRLKTLLPSTTTGRLAWWVPSTKLSPKYSPPASKKWLLLWMMNAKAPLWWTDRF